MKNRITGYSQVLNDLFARVGERIGNGVGFSDRTAAVMWSQGDIPLTKVEKGLLTVKLSQKTCLWKEHIDFFGLKEGYVPGAKER